MHAALAQMAPKVGDVDANLSKMEKVVAASGADLVVFGELFLSGYMARDRFPRLAEPLDGPSVGRVENLAAEYGAHVVFGMPERDAATDVLYNSAVLVTPDGAVHAYRKAYLANFGPFEEGVYFGRGRSLEPIPTKIGRLGLMICYDAFFPEIAKALALKGADLLAIPSAGPNTSIPLFHRVLPARAIENTVFVLYANLVGTQLNQVFSGGSVALGPRGEVLGRAPDHEEHVVHVDVDLRDLKVARELRPTLRDTRWEVLEDLLRLRGKDEGA
jgi:predicted amidohydrolase